MNMKDERKQIIVRLHPDLLIKLGKLADSEYRSINGEIEYLVSCAVSESDQPDKAFFETTSEFLWDGDTKRLVPMPLREVRLSDLKKYEQEKRALVENTKAFLLGLPAQNVLLQGGSGTGKTSSVRVLVSEYKSEGLRLIKINRRDISDLTRIIGALSQVDGNYKFILLITDLPTVEEIDYSGLKAVIDSNVPNLLVYATTMREDLGVDYFGITVNFALPSKQDFFDILKSLLADRGVYLPDQTLSLEADFYCMEKGVSLRVARQLAGIIETKIRLHGKL